MIGRQVVIQDEVRAELSGKVVWAVHTSAEPISVAGARERVRATVTLGMLDSSVRLKAFRSAVVDVQIVPAPLERTVRDVPIRMLNRAPNVTAESSPSAVAVTLRGSREDLNRLVAEEIHAYVDLTGLGAGQYTLPVHADPVGDAGVTRVEPAVIRVRVTSVKD